MKKWLLLLFVSLSLYSFNQTDPLYAQFWNTQQRFNPAYTGLKEQHEIHALARWQWVDINGAPVSQLVSYGANFKKYTSGIGFVYEHDQIGYLKSDQVKLTYAYHLKFKDEHYLSVGVGAGTNIIALNGVFLYPDSSTSVTVDNQGIGFTSDLGMFYTIKRFDAGFSMTRLVESYTSPGFNTSPHCYLYAGYLFGKKEAFQIKPQFFYRLNNGFGALDLSALFAYQSRYFLGATFRNRDAYAITAGYTFKDIINLSYTYELTVSGLNNSVAGGSHEVHLGLFFGAQSKD
ncbi:MAG: hypothetical protein RIT43_2393 [Bacteroidota bacterium]|jgi:type IX secretion system PorP/SprF family membrane protein